MRRRVSLTVIDHAAPVGAGKYLPGAPHTRDECKAIYRDAFIACPFIACRHHMYLVTSADMPGRRESNRNPPASSLAEQQHGDSCALDIAERKNNAGVVAAKLGLTRRRIEQITKVALKKLKAAGIDLRELMEG